MQWPDNIFVEIILVFYFEERIALVRSANRFGIIVFQYDWWLDNILLAVCSRWVDPRDLRWIFFLLFTIHIPPSVSFRYLPFNRLISIVAKVLALSQIKWIYVWVVLVRVFNACNFFPEKLQYTVSSWIFSRCGRGVWQAIQLDFYRRINFNFRYSCLEQPVMGQVYGRILLSYLISHP